MPADAHHPRAIQGRRDRPDVAVFTLGGTIAMTRADDGGIAPGLSGSALLASVPGLDTVATITVTSPLQRPGASLDIPALLALAASIQAALAAGAAGVVVVQGTDTIEETAFILDCILSTPSPVVVTGAMRGPEAAGADGPANLLAASIVAASGARDTGVLVVLGDTVHAALFVHKAHTGLPDAFSSFPYGPVGHVFESRFHRALYMRPQVTLDIGSDARISPVALVQVGMGDDGRMLNHLEAMGYEGVILAAMGAGHVPAALTEPLEVLARTMPVILSSRVAGGPVFERTYGFSGSEIDLLGRGLMHGGALGPLKARLLLQLAIAAGLQHDQLRQMFSAHEQRP